MSVRDWLRRIAGPDPELAADRDNLAAQVDALAVERDALTEEIRRTVEASDQRARDLRAARRSAVAEAYEPVQVGDCRKIRYLHRDDAEQHAIRVAHKTPGLAMNAYECRSCPTYPNGIPVWHAGHTQPGAPGSFVVTDHVLAHACGCSFALRTGESLWACDSHRGVAS